MNTYKIPVKTIEIRMTVFDQEAEDLAEARKAVGEILSEHGEETDYGEVVEYRNLIVLDEPNHAYDHHLEHPLTDPKGHVILGRFGNNAVLFMPECEYQPFVYASTYDPETGEWWYGRYGATPVEVWP